MPLVHIHNFGSVGLVTDIPSGELPLQGFTAAKNVRFSEGSLKRVVGMGPVYGRPVFAPVWLMPVLAPDLTFFWLSAGLTGVEAILDFTHFDITRESGGYSAVEGGPRWSGGSLGGIPVINNGVDIPQMWVPVSSAQKLQDLSNWPLATTAKVLRPFGNFLVALDVTKEGVRFPWMVKWSSAAAPGTVPETWDPSEPTREAGEFQIGEEGGELLDCLPLRGMNVIYQESGAHLMVTTGGVQVFGFKQVLDSGILGPDCAVRVFGGSKHFLVTRDDIGLFDGQSFESIATQKIRRDFFRVLDPTNFRRSFVVLNKGKEEVLVCIPQAGDFYPTAAYVWNVVSGTWSFREFPSTPFGAAGALDSGSFEETGGVWDEDNEAWDLDLTVWDSASVAGVLSSRTIFLIRKPDAVEAGNFAIEDPWNLGSGWNISGGLATKTAGTASDVSQEISVLQQSRHYEVVVVVSSRTAGELTPKIGDGVGTAIVTNGTHRQVVTGAGTGILSLAFAADPTFDGSITGVIAREVGFLRDDDTTQIDGVDPVVLAERQSISLTGSDDQRNRKAAFDEVMLVKELWMSGLGSPFKVYIGSQDTSRGPITWTEPFMFNPEVDRKVDPAIPARFVALKFEDAGVGPWEISKVAFEVDGVGRY